MLVGVQPRQLSGGQVAGAQCLPVFFPRTTRSQRQTASQRGITPDFTHPAWLKGSLGDRALDLLGGRLYSGSVSAVAGYAGRVSQVQCTRLTSGTGSNAGKR